jgi:hypothetical protein
MDFVEAEKSLSEKLVFSKVLSGTDLRPRSVPLCVFRALHLLFLSGVQLDTCFILIAEDST